MRVKSISTRSLFGVNNYDIELKRKDRISIIHGPNGCGKTTVLRFLADISNLNFESFWSTPFALFSVEFDNEVVLSVHKQENSSRRRGQSSNTLKVSRKAPGKKIQSFTMKNADSAMLRYSLSRYIERHIPWLRRIGYNDWLDTRDGEVMNEVKVRRLVVVHQRSMNGIGFSQQPFGLRDTRTPKWLSDTAKDIRVLFIETQRLVTLSRGSDEPDGASSSMAVAQFSRELADAIKLTLAKSAEISQSLDRTLPSRLLKGGKQGQGPSASALDIQTKYKEQTEKRRRLIDAGLLEAEEDVALPSRALNAVERRVLEHYLSDVDQRLQIFDSLLSKIELFKSMINKRFRNKKMRIQKDSGMIFVMDGSEQIIPSTALSSGEQHELVLAYQLIFKVEPGTLVLIDEPELSLHVTWQHEFLTDVKNVSELADLDFLIATHSPQIVHKRWDLAIALDGGVE